MRLEPGVSTAGKIAAVLGFVQGVTWTVLSLLAIIFGIKGVTFEQPKTYTELLSHQIYSLYLNNDLGNTSDFKIAAKEFTIFMWIYFVLSICWIAVSVDLLIAVVRSKQRHPVCMVLWSTITLVISILDIVLFGFVLSDYLSGCSDEWLDSTSTMQLYSTVVCHTVTGIVMTLAARGFTLWAVNISFAFVLIKLSQKIFEKRDRFRDILESDYSIPRVTLPRQYNGSGSKPKRELSHDSTSTIPANNNNNNMYVLPPTPRKGNDKYYY